ncbi:hypothetical protein HMPREF9630_01490 [Peptoanaerobacter stomatis]|uniref:Uncharacterized protein n=1 Tax=Peptoanaerobacter stomatis TaxID=796937 RepID=V9HQM0_9FIRM|nr:hypothetical protein [Peptoanaerobacter stomatis]EHL17800.1 hypothetical protein HMPREF9630_01490 [Peptoanaerobacter stomatis]
MRGKRRSQRIRDYRKARFERAISVIEGKNFHRSKMSRGNKIVLFVILAILLGMNFFSMRYRAKTFDFSKDDFASKYEQFIVKNKDKFDYDKSIKDIIENNGEYSFLQESSSATNSLIAVYQYSDKVKKIGVIGIPREDADFEKAYIENVSVIISLIVGKNYNDCKEYLRDINILDKNYNIRKEKELPRVKINSNIINFSYKESSLIFSIEAE